MVALIVAEPPSVLILVKIGEQIASLLRIIVDMVVTGSIGGALLLAGRFGVHASQPAQVAHPEAPYGIFALIPVQEGLAGHGQKSVL